MIFGLEQTWKSLELRQMVYLDKWFCAVIKTIVNNEFHCMTIGYFEQTSLVTWKANILTKQPVHVRSAVVMRKDHAIHAEIFEMHGFNVNGAQLIK